MEQKATEISEVEALRSELDGAYETIASLTSMLDRTLSMVERLTDGEIALTPADLAATPTTRIDGDEALRYVNVDDVGRMFGCSKTTAGKYMREAGAASIGTKLIAKHSTMVEYAKRIGKTVG